MMQPLLLLLAAYATAANAIDPINYFDATSLTSDEKEGYVSWLASSSSSADYPMHAFLPTANAEDGAAIFWSLHPEEKLVKFAIAVRATGWAGLGISQAGGMIGSDIVLFQSSNPDEVVDSYVVEEYDVPWVDDCPDWNLINATMTDDGWMIVEVSRFLDTNDSQDWPIVNDKELWSAPTRLIAAWGDSPSAMYHGQSNARGSVRLHAEPSFSSESAALGDVLEEQSNGLYFDVREDNHQIPARETQYHDVCKTFEELNIDQTGGITMIGVVPIISEETRQHIHHFTAYLQPNCDSPFPRSMIYIWAPGDEGWAMPEHVGFPLFHSENAQAIQLEIHYDNPTLIEGMVDSSGVRLYYSNEEREEKAAILELGDAFVGLAGQNINAGLTRYQFTCPGECSANVGSGSVTILNEYLHMHQNGVRMTNEVIRNDEVVRASSVDVYDFEQQGGFHVPQQPYEVLPGDGFRTTCYYRDGDKFGLDSDEEMCIAFVMYYPAKEFAGNPWMCPYGIGALERIGCEQELEFSDVASDDNLGRSFGTSNECAVDSLLPAPTQSPVTAAPTTSARPSVVIEPCVVCPDGSTADIDYVIPDSGGATCSIALAYIEATMDENTDSCTQVKEVESVCCPTLAANPCPFCSSGLTSTASSEVPGADGATCGDLVENANYLEEDSETCGFYELAEPFCCPTGDAVTPCPFCPDGITLDASGLTSTASSEVPGADGATCGDLVENANYLEEDSETCGFYELAEPFCCPTGDAVTPCPFCPDGITLDEDFVIPGAPNGETCGDLVEIARTSDGNGEICPQVQAAEIICCPSVEEVTTPPTTESLETPTVKPTSKSTPSPTASPELVATGLVDPSAGATLHGVRNIVTLALLSIFYVLV
eukprot:CAMPEP_0201989938 /NCGR_PEP_ID=MMETSP0904-20121228/93111_1 /ASSEMBLY_ACC=CAM_ASM_000553 /TAXON_ID=420261 /ORGANISM="Thalassiosira antarctica, Strain CCMP982" /LENGTH=880 /DNA_ID=CAMNT_0048544185 /DNA_START=21 /DNA_END=2663 /DNA_ORIENTATION=-